MIIFEERQANIQKPKVPAKIDKTSKMQLKGEEVHKAKAEVQDCKPKTERNFRKGLRGIPSDPTPFLSFPKESP
jgi:hypothetical protein